MSFLNDLLGKVGGQGSPDQASSIGPLVGQLLEQNGGLQGLMARFSEGGLEDVFGSWVGSGENAAVSGEQIQSALGSEQIAGFAQQLGLDGDKASGLLAEVLPNLVDRLTPGGEVGDGTDEGGLLGSVLDGLFSSR